MTWDRGYRPLVLDALWNAPLDALDDADDSLTGTRSLHGLPFRFGPAPVSEPGMVRVTPATGPVTVPVDEAATWVLVAHAVEEPELFAGDAVGGTLAEYEFGYTDETTVAVPIRQRLEIGTTPRTWAGRPLPLDWGQTPFLALPDAQHRLMHRTCGRYDAAGARLVDIDDPQARSPYVLPYRFYLWPWRSPRRGAVVRSLRVRSLGPSVLIGALWRAHVSNPDTPIRRMPIYA